MILHNDYNTAADVFSYGMVLWEVSTRVRPYDGHPLRKKVMELLAQVAYNGLRPAIPPTVPPSLAALIKSCWETDPTRRPTLLQIKSILAAKDCIAPDLMSVNVQSAKEWMQTAYKDAPGAQ